MQCRFASGPRPVLDSCRHLLNLHVRTMPIAALIPLVFLALLHHHAAAQQRAIIFPDTPDYMTLVCDLHMHTVFSDGNVWPTIRVEEAMRDGIDCIAVTEHLEYQPHESDIPHPDRNRAYEVATDRAENSDLIVLNGSEITRDLPPGHSNAIFVKDANALLQDDPVVVFREARSQGAFVFWNHPNWTSQSSDGVAVLTDMHRMLIEEDLLHGIEVANEDTYSDEALEIALEHNLAIIGTSDIHGLIDWQFDVPGGGHRPVTLIFADERSREGLSAALEARRTVAWFRETLVGRESDLMPLLEASIRVSTARYGSSTSVLAVELENTSSSPFLLRNLSSYTFHGHSDVITLPPLSSTTVHVKTIDHLESVELSFEVLNAVTAPGTHPDLKLHVDPIGE